MGKPKKRPATAPAYRLDKKTKSVPAAARIDKQKFLELDKKAKSPPKVAKKEKKKTMSDQMQELEIQVEKLEEENAALKDTVTRLERAAMVGTTTPARKWIRGKLPGEKLIKTDTETGEFQEIDQAEFDSLA
jgi:predicted RNase H-like nuclease (RuvC/YqgF family)